MLVVVGHGPSIVGRGLGPWLDTQTVVRLKWAERPNAEDWGTRTDYVYASHSNFFFDRERLKKPKLNAEYWMLPQQFYPELPGIRQGSRNWIDYFAKHREASPVQRKTWRKASCGLKAVFCAVEFLQPEEIGLIGFDMILHPEVPTFKWNTPPGKYSYAHDAETERRALMALPVKITEL